VLNELIHSRQWFNRLIQWLQTVDNVYYTGLVMPECTRVVIDPLYHSRHNGRDRQ